MLHYQADKSIFVGVNLKCFSSRANSKISELQRSKAAEIAKLTALLRKSDMRIASLERSVEQKVKIEIFFYLIADTQYFQSRENQELTTICDELIAKVGQP